MQKYKIAINAISSTNNIHPNVLSLIRYLSCPPISLSGVVDILIMARLDKFHSKPKGYGVE